jgi:Tfp pilus assembly protein FimT
MGFRFSLGVTLPELLVSMGIVSLLTGLGVPALFSMQQKFQTTAIVNTLSMHLHFARNHAITHNSTVTLCGSRAGEECDGAWSAGYLVFVDDSQDGKLDDNEQRLKFSANAHGGSMTWKSFRNKAYLQFRPSGFSYYQSGSFTWCPASKNTQYANQVILSAMGRSRLGYDRDGDGVVETSQGKPIRCL